jgi:hypothetical protein
MSGLRRLGAGDDVADKSWNVYVNHPGVFDNP